MKFGIRLIASLMITGLSYNAVFAQCAGSWSTARRSLTTARSGAAGGVINGKLYVAEGSFSGGGATTALEEYDPVTDVWTSKTSSPVNRAYAGAGVMSNKLYLVGGCSSADCIAGLTNGLYAYDPSGNSWATRASMTTARTTVAVGVVGTKMYVAGGMQLCGPCTPLTTLEIYDEGTNTWSSGAAMPAARSHVTGAVISGKFYVAGGSNGTTAQSSLYEYDPVGNSWSTKASMPTARYAANAAVLNGKLYVFGGHDGTNYLATVEVYDPVTNTWASETSMPRQRYFSVAGTIGNNIFVAAGSNSGSSWLDNNDMFTPAGLSANISSNNATVCAGNSSTFTANVVSAGGPVSFQWKVNGSNAGTNYNTFTYGGVNGDIVSCVVSNSCAVPASVTTNSITAVRTAVSVPAVSISASATTICAGTSVTFTATPTNGGPSPIYQWKKNGSNVGTNSATFVDATLAHGDNVWCVLTGSALCTSPPTAASNVISMTVNPVLAPAVSIASSVGSSGCAGVNITFTATPTNGGSSPAYQWKRNGSNVGTNSATFTTNILITGDVITCVLTSSYTCASPATATSNPITMTINPVLTASVSISASATTICAGTSVTFTATPTNPGLAPIYQWKVNGTNAGTNSTTFTTTSLNHNNVVTCQMTSNATCASPVPVTSNAITMTVNPFMAPVASIVSDKTSVCSGNTITFTVGHTNAGSPPSFQWKVNGGNVGTNSQTFTYAPVSGDAVSCVVTSTYMCPSPATVTTNTISPTVTTTVAPNVVIAASATTICNGTSVTFTATPTNGGGSPAYQWKKNNVNVGTNSATYVDAGLVNNDKIQCVMTSSASCVSPPFIISNQLTMTVNPILTPSVSIVSDKPGNSGCLTVPVTFTATPTNGGTPPAYQWKKNGGNVGTNSATYTDATIANGDVISCVMTTSYSCPSTPTATSNSITMTMNAQLPASVTISTTSPTTVCQNTSVTFAASPTNGGSTPVYQWKVNGLNVGTNSSIYTTSSLPNGSAQVTCVMTSNATCATPVPVTSNAINMTVNPLITPTISITANQTTVCAGTPITFTAIAANAGSAPSFQWKVNGANAGTNSNTFLYTPTNGQVISCVLTSSYSCPNPASVTSNSITVTVNPLLANNISISTPATTVCTSATITFTATASAPGTSPVYQWKRNGANVGTNSTVYSSTVNNGDQIWCILVSSACVTPAGPVQSNVITMSVLPFLTPSVSITSDWGTSGCLGVPITYTATPVNGGNPPNYQWRRNGINIGTNSNQFISSTIVSGDVINCIMTSTYLCPSPATATSNNITMTMNPVGIATMGINATPTANICPGQGITFYSAFSNGGSNPLFQWKKNGTDIPGATLQTYVSNNFANNDVIECKMTSSAICVFPVTSAPVTVTVSPYVIHAVQITATPGVDITEGQPVTFTCPSNKRINSGSTPLFQWRKNTLDIPGATDSVYTASDLKHHDEISLIVHSSINCATPENAQSNVMTINWTTGINRVIGTIGNFELYPNPNKGVFTIKGDISSNDKEIKIEVLNALGQVVYTETANVSGKKIEKQVNLTDVANGVYVLRMRGENEAVSRRFSIER
jgi:N-acetylneuraminic acid mutarotase